MGRPPSETLTGREAEIMDVLWDRQSATAEEIRVRLKGKPHDSTVRTLLRILERKGFAKHQASPDGPAVYMPAAPRVKAQKKALRSLLDRFFRGSTESLLLRLIEDEGITAQLIEELKQNKPSKPKTTKRPNSNDDSQK